MQRYFFRISYDGSSFNGWQIQPKVTSVQETIEQTLGKLFAKSKLPIVGCGRTDTGVHASCYFFHVDLPDNRYDEADLLFKVNGMLPSSIAVSSVFKVANDFHARFDAVSRTYRYFIHQQKDPFKNLYSYYYRGDLDFDKMSAAAQLLKGRQDFTSFSRLHTDVKSNFCEVAKAEWVKEDQYSYYFEITANRFLRNMVRAIVGTLLEVGKNKLTIDEFQSVIAQKNRSLAGASAPANGLFLYNVVYPFDDQKE